MLNILICLDLNKKFAKKHRMVIMGIYYFNERFLEHYTKQMGNDKQDYWHIINRFFQPVLHKPYNFIICWIIALIGAWYSISYAIFFWKLVKAIEKWDISSLILWIIIFGLTVFLWFIIRLNDRKFFLWAWKDADSYIYDVYIKKFFLSDNTDVEKIGTGRIISILRSWITNRSLKITESFRIYLKSIFIIIFSLGIILLNSTIFFWVTILVFVIIFFRIKKIWFNSIAFRKKAKETATEQDRHIIKQIMSKFEIMQNNKIKTELDKYIGFNKKMFGYRWREKFWQSLWYDGANFFVNILRVVVLWIVGYFAIINGYWTSGFVLFATLTGILISTIESLSDIWKSLADGMVHVEKLRNVFDGFKIDEKFDKWERFNFVEGNILIKNISFSYDKSYVFQKFNLTLKWWTKTAFVGESWSGKTTLIKLLAWYIKPDKGDIIIDWQKLSEIKLTDYYRQIGYLTQEPSVFDGTIFENLVYALDSEPQKEVLEHVIKLSKCEFIREFEKGLETEIGERWVRLSWWQKQRLAIAKIMLKNPNVILLDEPTSALDSFNEEQIGIALHNLFKWKTVIVVAHRLQTVKQSDRICYIDQWKIIEDGTHDELVELWGRYKKMLDLQSWF